MRHIYLDYNATTPIAPSVQEAMLPFLAEHYGDPSSSHALGRACLEALEDARGRVAGLLGCEDEEVVFTSGGTEANNLALKGVMLNGGAVGDGHLVISALEHPAVTEPARYLERLGFDVTVVRGNVDGVVEPDDVAAALRPDTRLVSIMHANDVIGTVQPLRRIAKICRARGVLLHTDAVQSVGKIRAAVDELDVDLLSLSAHKFYGPKGVGALYVRHGVPLESLLHGAGNEGGMRAGTENVPHIVAMGRAASLTAKSLDQAAERLTMLREKLLKRLRETLGEQLTVNGCRAERLPNTLSVNFPRVSGQALLARIPELCASPGECHGDHGGTSGALSAIGLPAQVAAGTVRLCVGWYTSEEQVDRAASLLIAAWEDLISR
ncbi:MAG: cysteine desulfurase family protein [Pirellulaceae bacterium]